MNQFFMEKNLARENILFAGCLSSPLREFCSNQQSASCDLADW